jgi:hypothetical protein
MSLGERIITALTGKECGDESNYETPEPGLRLAGVVRF